MQRPVVNRNRVVKARKIHAVLSDFMDSPVEDKTILDIGTGNGEIAEYFSENNTVHAVDIKDQRKNKDSGVLFKKISSEKQPFDDLKFDIVLSNHVIEHTPNHRKHLSEIKRVLKKEGVCYLATPNRLFPVEPHNKLPFLHYLPWKPFNAISRKITGYDDKLYLLSYFNLVRKLTNHFQIEEYTHKIAARPHKYHFRVPLLNKLPQPILKRMNFLSPTNVFILKKSS